jgi:crotonobetainyl-CoA:carnitine CoA-transferase CaiB-like acyl-CoA transferase
MAITGEPSGNPMKVGTALADVIAGKDAAITVLGALVQKARTGRGGRYGVSLADSARAALVNVGQNALVSGRDAQRWGNAHPNLVPYELFHASDRPIVVAVGSDAQWVACCRALDLDAFTDDAALATNAGRLEHRERIVTAITRRMAQKPADHWAERLSRAGVPNGLVQTVLEALRDSGASPVTGVPPSVPGAIRFEPPRLDEHGDQIRSRGWGVFEGR